MSAAGVEGRGTREVAEILETEEARHLIDAAQAAGGSLSTDEIASTNLSEQSSFTPKSTQPATLQANVAFPNEADLKAGQGLALPAQTHSAVNTGRTVLKALVVEIKPAPAAAPPK